MQQLHPKAVWLFYIRSLGIALLPFIILSSFLGPFFSLLLSFSQENYLLIIIWLFVLFAVYIAFVSIWGKLSYKNWKYQLTNDSIQIEKGVIMKKYTSIPYERIQNVDILRGVLDRALGLSDLQIQTAGYSVQRSLFGGYTEGRLPGLNPDDAVKLREDIIHRSKTVNVQTNQSVQNPPPQSKQL